ncbi:hypothetical protein CDAR_562291 [Caerostris darwini]|uniref:Uncharacterized protein n=1 Tax=Caerostris darwini TaxID=1538125 RepID=A0AAV4RJR2_9ARAC|nr:hypothetical protein CDAR_562291 [Caerostris darwini]
MAEKFKELEAREELLRKRFKFIPYLKRMKNSFSCNSIQENEPKEENDKKTLNIESNFSPPMHNSGRPRKANTAEKLICEKMLTQQIIPENLCSEDPNILQKLNEEKNIKTTQNKETDQQNTNAFFSTVDINNIKNKVSENLEISIDCIKDHKEFHHSSTNEIDVLEGLITSTENSVNSSSAQYGENTYSAVIENSKNIYFDNLPKATDTSFKINISEKEDISETNISTIKTNTSPKLKNVKKKTTKNLKKPNLKKKGFPAGHSVGIKRGRGRPRKVNTPMCVQAIKQLPSSLNEPFGSSSNSIPSSAQYGENAYSAVIENSKNIYFNNMPKATDTSFKINICEKEGISETNISTIKINTSPKLKNALKKGFPAGTLLE